MKKLISICISVFLINTASASTFLDNLAQFKTTHGIPVYFVPRPQIPMVDIRVIFDAGSARDGERYGLASLTSAMLGEGAVDMNSDRIARLFDSVGAIPSSRAGKDFATVGLRTLSNKAYYDRAVETFINVITMPTFPEDAITRVKKLTIDSILDTKQNSMAMANIAFYKALYGKQPYGHPIPGTMVSVPALTREDVIRFYQQYYVRENAKIIIVGNLHNVDAHALAERIDQHLASGERPLTFSRATAKAAGEDKLIPADVNQNAIVIGEMGIDNDDPRIFDLAVANRILGSGFTSRLFKEVRNDRGLAYYVGSSFTPLKEGGPFSIGLMTRTDKSVESTNLTLKTLKTYLAEGPTEEEMQSAKQNLINGFPLTISTNRDVLGRLVVLAFYNLPLDRLANYAQHVEAVTQESAKEAFTSVIKFEKLNTITVGKKQDDSKNG